MTNVSSQWRPLGIETEEEIASYDALHEGVPAWIHTSYWRWVRQSITTRRMSIRSSNLDALDESFFEKMCTILQIPVPDFRQPRIDIALAQQQLDWAIKKLQSHENSLQIADYILAHKDSIDAGKLAEVLQLGKSGWQVGERAGLNGLTRRVPSGVQVAVDSIIGRQESAGIKLAKAWENIYGLTPNPSEAYSLAIKAIEDAAIPLVSPKNSRATLGTVIRDMKNQGDWTLPLGREKESQPSGEVVIGMMELVWHGQHDRHGGQPSAPGLVSLEEATVAVTMAVSLVNILAGSLVTRKRTPQLELE